jgi:hypothetical protein
MLKSQLNSNPRGDSPPAATGSRETRASNTERAGPGRAAGHARVGICVRNWAKGWRPLPAHFPRQYCRARHVSPSRAPRREGGPGSVAQPPSSRCGLGWVGNGVKLWLSCGERPAPARRRSASAWSTSAHPARKNGQFRDTEASLASEPQDGHSHPIPASQQRRGLENDLRLLQLFVGGRPRERWVSDMYPKFPQTELDSTMLSFHSPHRLMLTCSVFLLYHLRPLGDSFPSCGVGLDFN